MTWPIEEVDPRWGRRLFIADYAIAVMTNMDYRVDSSELAEAVRNIAWELEYERMGYNVVDAIPIDLAKHIRGRCLYEIG